MKSIELTEAEKALVEHIDFDPASLQEHDPAYWQAVGIAAQKLMESLLRRQAIPEVRRRYFTDPEFNAGGRGRSHLEIFRRNGTDGDAVFRHPHFLKYLHYFLYGPDLPPHLVQAFENEVAACGMITSSDIAPLGKAARNLVKSGGLNGREVAEEFYKLALDCGLDVSDSCHIRDAVKR